MRLIDADAYKKYLDENWIVANYNAIDAQPTIDALPVVRCGVCKNWDLDWSSNRDPDLHYCWIIDSFTDCKFYCKEGHRRTNDGK